VRVVSGLGDATQSLERQARTLGRQADDLLAAGAPSVDLIGFSAGGVVARIWAEDGGSVHARRVVTLGSPHHGTEVAGLAALFLPGDCPAACRQLQPGSTLLRSLTGGAPGPNWVSIRTRADQISTPPSTAILPGAVNVAVQEVCPGVQVQHGMLPRTDFVVDLVVEALDGQDPLVSPPTTARSGCPARS
jgi:pimeloyl-ACP methyl ester carboxylesterase